MADNFLEKRMEDHRRGIDHGRYTVANQSRRRKLNIDLEERKIAAIGEPTPLTDAIIEIAAQAGAKIAFSSENRREGMAKAQRSGALYVPQTAEKASLALIEAAMNRWGGLDTLLFSGITSGEAASVIARVPHAYSIFITDSEEEASRAVSEGMTVLLFSTTPPDLTPIAKFITHICVVNLPSQIILL